MKAFGFAIVAAAAIGAGLYFGGFVGGNVDVELTQQGRDTYNRGVDSVAEGIQGLKAQDAPAQK